MKSPPLPEASSSPLRPAGVGWPQEPGREDLKGDLRARRPSVLNARTLSAALRWLSLAVLDVAGVLLATWTALEVRGLVRDEGSFGSWFTLALEISPLACLVTVLLFARSGLYGDHRGRPGFPGFAASLVQATLVVLVYAFLSGERFSSYYVFWGSLLFAIVYVGGFRWLFDRLTAAVLRSFGAPRRTALVGPRARIGAVAPLLFAGERNDVQPLAFVAPPAETGIVNSALDGQLDGLRDLGSLSSLVRELDSLDEVLILDPDFPEEDAVQLVDRCHRKGVAVRVVPSTMAVLMERVELVPGQTLPTFELKPPVFEGFDFALKRSFDVVVAGLLLAALAPLMIVIAIAVKTTSTGRVLYRSIRPGVGGQPFACLKFRTMCTGAERLQNDLETRNEMGGAIFKIRLDPRVTPIGRFLRRWSLDELPQLFNVVRGDMSLVGPRPLPQRDYDRLDDWHRRRNLILPGVTGLWQVSGRSGLSFDELVRLDFLYIERWSVLLDVSILAKTIPAVIRGRGAW